MAENAVKSKMNESNRIERRRRKRRREIKKKRSCQYTHNQFENNNMKRQRRRCRIVNRSVCVSVCMFELQVFECLKSWTTKRNRFGHF